MRLLLMVLLAGSLALNLAAAEKPNTKKKANLTSLPGLNEEIEAKLNAMGINNVNDLLVEGATPQGREELAARSGLPAPRILKFVHYADLFRINGIDGETVRLLDGAGVNTVAELARCNASNLQTKLEQVNKATKGKPPTEEQVAEWIEAAKALPKVVADWSCALQADGLPHVSPGQRPGNPNKIGQALKGRHKMYFLDWRALSGLGLF